MGTDKVTLEFCGTRMIDLVTQKLAALTDRIVVVTRRRRDLGSIGCLVIEDEQPFAGPLPALVAGLRATGAERNLVVACDMPFLNTELLQRLTELPGDADDSAVPITAAGPEPLHALYRDCAFEPLLSALAAGERSLRGALERMRVRWVEEAEWRPIDPDGRSFLNVNTPDEFRAAASMQAGA
jgi:molybdopterin-guanine dinucleotide biosynthesis protein A